MKSKIGVFLLVLSLVFGCILYNPSVSNADSLSKEYVPNQIIVKFKDNTSLSKTQEFHKSVGADVV